MITASEISMNFGSKILFDHVNVTFNSGERYGLTGPNGSGKSTFMKIMAGELEPVSGSVQQRGRLGVLRQDQALYSDMRIIDVVRMGNPALWAALDEKKISSSERTTSPKRRDAPR
jgi:ATPase subunit of ABC transporter with duplicated ATPase domains